MAQSDAVLLSVRRRGRESGAEQAEAAQSRERKNRSIRQDAAAHGRKLAKSDYDRSAAARMNGRRSRAANIVAAGEATLAAWQYKKAEADRAAQKSMTAAMRKARKAKTAKCRRQRRKKQEHQTGCSSARPQTGKIGLRPQRGRANGRTPQQSRQYSSGREAIWESDTILAPV